MDSRFKPLVRLLSELASAPIKLPPAHLLATGRTIDEERADCPNSELGESCLHALELTRCE